MENLAPILEMINSMLPEGMDLTTIINGILDAIVGLIMGA